MEPNAAEPSEKVLGLDPRALLGRVARERSGSSAGRGWEPPAVEEIAALFPQFEALEFIGRGGMGAVYRARQPALDRMVAIKILPADAAADAIFAERFRTEARALARLQHPRIVAIYESGQTPAGHLFIAMEYVDGSDLAALLRDGPLPLERALRIAAAVCAALEYAHAQGVIHRDIKPANVLLGGDGGVKVADFGLARLRGESAEISHLTMTGSALGTPAYMSPEQRAGRPVDARADLYSLGVMLYEMLTGDLPQGAWQPPSRKAGSSAALNAVVEKAVQADPARRLQSAAELRARIERVLHSMTPAARRRRAIRNVAAALAIVVGGAWLWPLPPRAEPEQPRVSAAAETPVAAPGTHRPLDALDLRAAAFSGAWSWQDEVAGGTLAVAYTHEKPSPKILNLPLCPGPRGYDLHGEILLEHRGGDLALILPAGHARPALVLDLYDQSGLEAIRDASWKTNESTVARQFPTGRYLPIAVSVRPAGERVAITVHIEGQPFIHWEGPQSDLSLPADGYPPGPINLQGPVISLVSFFGGAQIRALEVEILP